MLSATTASQFWSVEFARAFDKTMACPSCGVAPNERHRDTCDAEADPAFPGWWAGPKTPGMVLVELEVSDRRLQCSYCIKCDQSFFLKDRSVAADAERIFLTRQGFGMHLACVLDLASEILAPAADIAQEFEDRRRALLGE